jgi:hypothetical protein
LSTDIFLFRRLTKRRRDVILERLQQKLEDLQKNQLNASVELYYHQRLSDLSLYLQEGSERREEEDGGPAETLSTNISISDSGDISNVANQRRSSSSETPDAQNAKSSQKLKAAEKQVGITQKESDGPSMKVPNGDQELQESLAEPSQSQNDSLIPQVSDDVCMQSANIGQPQAQNLEKEDLLFGLNHVEEGKTSKDVNPEYVEKLMNGKEKGANILEITVRKDEIAHLEEGRNHIIKTFSDVHGSNGVVEENERFGSEDGCNHAKGKIQVWLLVCKIINIKFKAQNQYFKMIHNSIVLIYSWILQTLPIHQS